MTDIDKVHKLELPESENQENQPSDPFNPAKLRLSQRASFQPDARKLTTMIPVQKPSRQEFIRVHPDANWCLETAILEDKENRETYLVDADIWPEIPGETIPKVLYTTVNRHGTVKLWPIKLPEEDGSLDSWNRSALDAAERAKTKWIRVVADMNLSGYAVWEAASDLEDPEWPSLSFEEILKIAFKDHFIDHLDHPVMRRLRGEI